MSDATMQGSAASDPFEGRMEREHAGFLERARTGDLRTVVGALREWSEVESVPAPDEFDLILTRLETLTADPEPVVLPDGCVDGHSPDLVSCEFGAEWP